MKIIIETIPHNNQRYNTCGDWTWEDNFKTLHVKVSEMIDIVNVVSHTYMEATIGLHEVIEALQCQADGVLSKTVDDFDLSQDTTDDCEKLDIEPGDHPDAPYKQQHTLATGFERILCFCFGIPWYEYENQLITMTFEYDERKDRENSRPK